MDATSLRSFDELSAATGEALWPDSVTIGATAYACSIVRPRQALLLGDFAEEPEEITLTVRIRKSLLATAPLANTYLTWNSDRWKIRTIAGHSAADATWSLQCRPAP